jgi:NADP-dependent 3-hydroxy acid dehydrogenase YdfG
MIILIGASSGIGSLIIEKLLKTDDIIATYNRGKILDKKTFKHKLIKAKLDITSESQIINFVKKYKKIFNKITLINLSTIKLNQLIFVLLSFYLC